MSKDTTLNHKDLVEKLRSYAAEAKSDIRVASAYGTAATLLQTCNDIFGVPSTEEEDEQNRQREYILGQAVALEQLAAKSKQLAGEAFCQGNQDDKAKWYRDLAKECENQASIHRKSIKM